MLKNRLFLYGFFLIFGYGRLLKTEVSASDFFTFTLPKTAPLFQEELIKWRALRSILLRNFEWHPFFETRVFGNGAVLRINEVNYEGVPLLYDSRADWVCNFPSNTIKKFLIKIGEKSMNLEHQGWFGISGTLKGEWILYTSTSNGLYENHFGDGEIQSLAKAPQKS